jgi:hypothetical protein
MELLQRIEILRHRWSEEMETGQTLIEVGESLTLEKVRGSKRGKRPGHWGGLYSCRSSDFGVSTLYTGRFRGQFLRLCHGLGTRLGDSLPRKM